jgi:isopentenyl-diphosphate delta-isomerase
MVKNVKNVSRKAEHVEICATQPVQASFNYWEDILLHHQALPEVNKSEIDLNIKIFNKKLHAPIIISAMTGGYPKAKTINKNLAAAASELQVGFGVGSQRPALEDRKHIDTYTVVKDYDLPLVIGNIGAPQLIEQANKKKQLTVEDGRSALDMINADLLAIHMNFVQEIVQPEGDTNAKGCLRVIAQFAKKLPILAKETGAGVSRDTANRLKKAGVMGIDVGGLGGTSFPAVEMYRGTESKDKTRTRLGQTFWDWGIPTPVTIFEANVGLPIISTGGMRTGLDVAKALCLGAGAGGFAGRLLKAGLKGKSSVLDELGIIIEELRSAMFLIGAGSVKELKKSNVLITGEIREMLLALGYKI